jgi:hypothetical protein
MTHRADRRGLRPSVLLEQLEKALLDPAARLGGEVARELLDESFVEIGSSGKRYDKKTMIQQMVHQNPAPVFIHEFEARRLSPEVYVCTYRSIGQGGAEAFRSSIWVKREDGWRMVFHQGTRIADRWSNR